MTADWLDLAIENWARWHQQGMRRHPRRIKSLEGRWRSPQAWDAPPITPLGRVDHLAAEAVEHAWGTLPFVPKMVLKLWFVLRISAARICRSLRRNGFPVIPRDLELEIARAKLMLSEALAVLKKTEYDASVAVVCEPGAPEGGHPSLREAPQAA